LNNDNTQTVIISRTDAIGDVVLTLPLAALIKEILGNDTKILFFGKTYTYPVISCCDAIDGFLNFDTFNELDEKAKVEFLKEARANTIIHVFPRKDIAFAAKVAGIKNRIGTTNRLYHWFNCNRLVRLGRKNSTLHEAQLNIKLLSSIGFKREVAINDIDSYYHLTKINQLPGEITRLLAGEKFKLVIHPKSHSSAREWKPDHYRKLISMLPPEKFQIIITGGEKETSFINDWVQSLPPYVLNLAGKLSLVEMISLLNSCDGILAASTGPLHIAAALGKHALGIYPPIRPMHPQRWAPLGSQAEYLVSGITCSECRYNPFACHCMNDVSPETVCQRIMTWIT
jgi:ADP-heptose:LPS heptosyltransferase